MSPNLPVCFPAPTDSKEANNTPSCLPQLGQSVAGLSQWAGCKGPGLQTGEDTGQRPKRGGRGGHTSCPSTRAEPASLWTVPVNLKSETNFQPPLLHTCLISDF